MMKNPCRSVVGSVLLLSAPALAAPAPQPGAEPAPESSCTVCHAELADDAAEYLREWSRDTHREVGLGCEACHGGDPSLDVADDAEAAMDPARGFKAAPTRLEVADFCASCHSDAQFMKQYNPQARVDQLMEYRTSVHGRGNASGDPVPATCIDCHGIHGIRKVASPNSPVFAANVPATCSTCHADADIMRPYDLATDQYQLYLGSVHARALLDREDTAAPACNDCHGNHGAAPPGVRSVANVCGQCHGREAKLFRDSFKKEMFDSLDVSECAVCHDNHLVVHPTPELFRTDSAPRVSVGHVTGMRPFGADFGDLQPGQTAEATWTLVLPTHIEAEGERLAHAVTVSADGVEPLTVDATVLPGQPVDGAERRASSGGLAAVLVIDPLSGTPVKSGDALKYRLEVSVVGGSPLGSVTMKHGTGRGMDVVEGSVCLTCHEVGDECDRATEKMYAALFATESELREAERLLHEAEIAGMDVSQVQFELKSSGTNAAMDARALLHAFDPEQVVKRSQEARDVAAAALAAGQNALDELQFRRKGLAVSLVLIVLVLVGLYLKIREVDRRRRAT
jgi:hypothetical protein